MRNLCNVRSERRESLGTKLRQHLVDLYYSPSSSLATSSFRMIFSLVPHTVVLNMHHILASYSYMHNNDIHTVFLG